MDQTNVLIFVILVKIIIFVMAMVLSHLTYRAYRRAGEKDLLMLSIAFVCIMTGIVIEGIAGQILGSGLLVGTLIVHLFFALGLGFMIYSLYGWT